MRLLFLGDVVGRTGREAVARVLPQLRERHAPDLVVINGENAAHGFGITEDMYHGLVEAGADVVTLGNHAFDQREALVFIERVPNMLRPLNYPPGVPGKGVGIFTTKAGARVLVMNIMGRVMIEPQLDDPFRAVDRELDLCRLGEGCDAAIIDFHDPERRHRLYERCRHVRRL
jgi:calcineurin-like phosphoesterase